MLPKSDLKINDDVQLINREDIYNCYEDYRIFAEKIIGKELRPITQDWETGDIGFIEYIGFHGDNTKELLYVLTMETGTLITNREAIEKINLYERK